MTRTSTRWQSRPGSFDALHTRYRFPSQNRWGIPALYPTPLPAFPLVLLPYRQRIRNARVKQQSAVHFFLDDYRFETVWHRPHKALTALHGYGFLLAPDFSLYRDYPYTVQLWNVYRSRWCAAFWQAQGKRVIPTVSWSDHQSYPFCFAGIPQHTPVAISTVGIRPNRPLDHHLFMAGFQAMVTQLQPSVVLSYGEVPDACQQQVKVVCYPTRWQGIRQAQKQSPVRETTEREG